MNQLPKTDFTTAFVILVITGRSINTTCFNRHAFEIAQVGITGPLTLHMTRPYSCLDNDND